MEYIKKQLTEIDREIHECAVKAGRDPEEITLVAVSKTHPLEKIEYARDTCGIHCFGENRVQEAVEKFSGMNNPEELHFIGHLQSNKVRRIISVSHHIDAVDSERLMRKINQAAEDAGVLVHILFEYNISGEEAKSGFTSREELLSAIDAGYSMQHIEMNGLMTVGPLTSDERRIREAFRSMNGMYRDIIQQYPDISFNTLSMGMSSDFRIAIEEGSTAVRIGTRIFGERQYA